MTFREWALYMAVCLAAFAATVAAAVYLGSCQAGCELKTRTTDYPPVVGTKPDEEDAGR